MARRRWWERLFDLAETLLEGFWENIVVRVLSFFETVTTGLFRDKAISPGLKVNAFFDVVMGCLCIVVLLRAPNYLGFVSLGIWAVFALLCLVIAQLMD